MDKDTQSYHLFSINQLVFTTKSVFPCNLICRSCNKKLSTKSAQVISTHTFFETHPFQLSSIFATAAFLAVQILPLLLTNLVCVVVVVATDFANVVIIGISLLSLLPSSVHQWFTICKNPFSNHDSSPSLLYYYLSILMSSSLFDRVTSAKLDKAKHQQYYYFDKVRINGIYRLDTICSVMDWDLSVW